MSGRMLSAICELERKELIKEFLTNLKSIPTFEHNVQAFILDLRKKWEGRLKE